MDRPAAPSPWPGRLLVGLAVVLCFVGLVVLDARNDVPIGDEASPVGLWVGGILTAAGLGTGVVGIVLNPVRRVRARLRFEQELQRRAEEQ